LEANLAHRICKGGPTRFQPTNTSARTLPYTLSPSNSLCRPARGRSDPTCASASRRRYQGPQSEGESHWDGQCSTRECQPPAAQVRERGKGLHTILPPTSKSLSLALGAAARLHPFCAGREGPWSHGRVVVRRRLGILVQAGCRCDGGAFAVNSGRWTCLMRWGARCG
jgi:hypothetical protein